LPYYIIHCPDEDFDKVALECRDKGVTEMEAIGLMGLKEKLDKKTRVSSFLSSNDELEYSGSDKGGKDRKDPIIIME
jgi:hypothetical protein